MLGCAKRHCLHPDAMFNVGLQSYVRLMVYMDATVQKFPFASRQQSCQQLFMIGVRICRNLQMRGNRCFSLTSNLCSGHNRWSKIKHDKAKVDVCTQPTGVRKGND